MIKPIPDSSIDAKQSRYSLVIAVSKRARQISADAEKNKQILKEKPVEVATQEFLDNKFTIIEKPCENDDLES